MLFIITILSPSTFTPRMSLFLRFGHHQQITITMNVPPLRTAVHPATTPAAIGTTGISGPALVSLESASFGVVTLGRSVSMIGSAVVG